MTARPEARPVPAVGVASIDEAHQVVGERIAALVDAVRRGEPRPALVKAAVSLQNAVAAHFADEQDHMARAGYPAAAEHLERHEAFLNTFRDLRQELALAGATPEVVARVERQVGEWLEAHVHVYDAPLGEFLLKAGVR